VSAPPPRRPVLPPPKPSRSASDAFDLWLKRGLEQLFGKAAREPIPQELLDLTEADRKRRGGD
jgi:hypothetical protein